VSSPDPSTEPSAAPEPSVEPSPDPPGVQPLEPGVTPGGNLDEAAAFPNLRQAMLAWARDAVAALSAGPEPDEWRDLRRWQRDEDGIFRNTERTAPLWNRSAVAEAMQLRSWRAVKEAFQTNDRLRVQVDTLVGTSRSRGRFEVETAGKLVLPRPNEVNDLEDAFGRRYTKLETYLAAREFELAEVWPIPGLTSSQFPIMLEPDLELDWMSDEELAAALNTDLIPRTFGQSQVLFAEESKQACMRYRFRLPKVVGDQDTADPDFQERERRLAGIQETLQQALALLVADPVAIAGRMSLEVDPTLRSGVAYQPLVLTRSQRFRQLEMDASMAAELAQVWGQLRRPGLHKAIGLALRRLSYQAGRDRVEDEIVDILVAAEALYLSGIESPTELGFRLALRAAAFSDPSTLGGMTRREVYGTMNKAYGVRSKIVHGDVPRASDLKVRGARVSLTEFVQAIEDVIRQALREAVSRSTWPPNWDDLTVPR
jgi:hypothetical protein